MGREVLMSKWIIQPVAVTAPSRLLADRYRGPMGWRASMTLVCGLLAATAGGVIAQQGRAELNDGNRLYEAGRFSEAHEKYLEALRDAPDQPVALFNDGNALYESEEYVRALEAYRGAIESGDPALAGPAWYNLGNSLYRQQKFQESLEAYKQALRIDPDQVDYKHNLELAIEQLQQQEQDPENEDGDPNEQDQSGNPEDQDEPQDPDSEEEDQDDGEEEESDDPQETPEPEESPDEEPESGQPEPEPGEMTPEEAERLLQGVQEDPGEVNRRLPPLRGRRPMKPW
jgi:Ca-activated chloride channel family protein